MIQMDNIEFTRRDLDRIADLERIIEKQQKSIDDLLFILDNTTKRVGKLIEINRGIISHLRKLGKAILG